MRGLLWPWPVSMYGVSGRGPAVQACAPHPRPRFERALVAFPFGNDRNDTQKTYDTRESGLKFIALRNS